MVTIRAIQRLAMILGMIPAMGGLAAAANAHHGGNLAPRPALRAGRAGGYRFILPGSLMTRARWRAALAGKHHDYPAIDIAVPVGTPYFAVTAGTVAYTRPGNACGRGIMLYSRSGVVYTYCHGSKRLVRDGAKVSAGTELGLTGKTGDATGPHLHFQITYHDRLRCPQRLLWALYAHRRQAPQTRAGRAPDTPAARSLPTRGCVSPTSRA